MSDWKVIDWEILDENSAIYFFKNRMPLVVRRPCILELREQAIKEREHGDH